MSDDAGTAKAPVPAAGPADTSPQPPAAPLAPGVQGETVPGAGGQATLPCTLRELLLYS
ncbi:hypothetical protein HY251_04480 [bacterium]|nr:hypothetical protein [bacterium]